MRLRDRFNAAVQAFREAPNLRAQLDASEYQRSLAEQMLELRERECEGLHNELREKDDRLRFLYARADALSSALTLEVDTSTPEYQRFEGQLYRSVLEHMGFDGLLVPKQAGQTAEQVPAQNEIETMAM